MKVYKLISLTLILTFSLTQNFPASAATENLRPVAKAQRGTGPSLRSEPSPRPNPRPNIDYAVTLDVKEVMQGEYPQARIDTPEKKPIFEIEINGKVYKLGRKYFIKLILRDETIVYWAGDHNFAYPFMTDHSRDPANPNKILFQDKGQFVHIDAHEDWLPMGYKRREILEGLGDDASAHINFGLTSLWNGNYLTALIIAGLIKKGKTVFVDKDYFDLSISDFETKLLQTLINPFCGDLDMDFFSEGFSQVSKEEIMGKVRRYGPVLCEYLFSQCPLNMFFISDERYVDQAGAVEGVMALTQMLIAGKPGPDKLSAENLTKRQRELIGQLKKKGIKDIPWLAFRAFESRRADLDRKNWYGARRGFPTVYFFIINDAVKALGAGNLAAAISNKVNTICATHPSEGESDDKFLLTRLPRIAIIGKTDRISESDFKIFKRVFDMNSGDLVEEELPSGGCTTRLIPDGVHIATLEVTEEEGRAIIDAVRENVPISMQNREIGNRIGTLMGNKFFEFLLGCAEKSKSGSARWSETVSQKAKTQLGIEEKPQSCV